MNNFTDKQLQELVDERHADYVEEARKENARRAYFASAEYAQACEDDRIILDGYRRLS